MRRSSDVEEETVEGWKQLKRLEAVEVDFSCWWFVRLEAVEGWSW